MMRAISLHQPWASLIACGAKKIETRWRLTHVRGLVAIHATLNFPYVPREDVIPIIFALDPKARPLRPDDYLWGLPRGVIVGVVEIYACLPTETILSEHPDWANAEKHFGDFSPGRFGWFLKNNIALKEPVKCKGRQGFFFLPADVEKQVKAQL